MPVSNFQDKSVSVLSAEKTEWSGGRAGVKGIIYTVKLKAKKDIIIKSLLAEGSKIPFSQNTAENIIVVQGNLQYKNNNANIEDLPSGAPVENARNKADLKESWVEYTLKSSGKSYKINIPKFVLVETQEELAP